MSKSIDSSTSLQRSLANATMLREQNLSTSPAQSLGFMPSALSIFSTLSGLFGALYGGYLAKTGYFEFRRAMSCNDEKGIMTGAINTCAGSAFAGMGAMMCANGSVRVLPLMGVAPTRFLDALGELFSPAVDALGILMYGLYLVSSLMTLTELRAFKNDWKCMLDKPRGSTRAKAQECLSFIQDKLFLTEQEKKDLKSHSPEQIQMHQQRKRDQLIRCLGKNFVERIEKELPNLQQEVKNGPLQATQQFIIDIDRAHFKQKAIHITMCAAGIIGMFGSALSLALGGAPVCLPCFALASILYWFNEPISRLAHKIYVPALSIEPKPLLPTRVAIV